MSVSEPTRGQIRCAALRRARCWRWSSPSLSGAGPSAVALEMREIVEWKTVRTSRAEQPLSWQRSSCTPKLAALVQSLPLPPWRTGAQRVPTSPGRERVDSHRDWPDKGRCQTDMSVIVGILSTSQADSSYFIVGFGVTKWNNFMYLW